jgi:hypothetical protein
MNLAFNLAKGRIIPHGFNNEEMDKKALLYDFMMVHPSYV